MKTHDENVDDGSYTCGICSYQNNTIDQLKDHIALAHGTLENMLLICDQCGKKFRTDKELTSHIKDNHKTYKPCDYFVENRCEQSSTTCRYNHIKLKQENKYASNVD